MKPIAPNPPKRRGTMGVPTPAARAEAARVPSRAEATKGSAGLAAVFAALRLCAACATATPASPPPSGVAASPSPVASATSPESSPSPSPSASPGSLPIDQVNFVAAIDNAWLPFKPGTTMRYRGTKDEEPAIEVFTVTNRTATIDGVRCVVIDDRLFLSGRLAERTSDYYVQDKDGNVWYFGEDTQELDAKGKVISAEGTWHAGVDGAQPGIFMEANPTVGHSYLQGFYKGHAEDHFSVESLNASIKVPYGSFTGALRTREWTPLEPGVIDNKFYVHGVGEVKEVTAKGPLEELSLVSIKRP